MREEKLIINGRNGGGGVLESKIWGEEEKEGEFDEANKMTKNYEMPF